MVFTGSFVPYSHLSSCRLVHELHQSLQHARTHARTHAHTHTSHTHTTLVQHTTSNHTVQRNRKRKEGKKKEEKKKEKISTEEEIESDTEYRFDILFPFNGTCPCQDIKEQNLSVYSLPQYTLCNPSATFLIPFLSFLQYTCLSLILFILFSL